MKVAPLSLLALVALPLIGFAQSMPGYVIAPYATVSDPVRMTIANNGDLYVGRDLAGSGGTNAAATYVRRVSNGGATVTDLGNTAIVDPDVVFFDADGTFSGLAGSSIVGSYIASNGALSRIAPDGTVTPLYSSSNWHNPTDFVLDGTGRLLFSDGGTATTGNAGVWAMTSAAAPVIVFGTTGSSPYYLAVDASDQIWLTRANGVIEVRSSAGVVVDANFATLTGSGPIAFGNGGDFGTFLYGGAPTQLLRFDANGGSVVLGTGFTQISGVRFGPDNALYVADFAADRILRVTRAHADLAASGDDTPDPVSLTNSFTWTLVAHNDGPDTAEITTLSFSLPTARIARVDNVSASQGSCAAQSCALGTIPLGANATVTVSLTALAEGVATTTVALTSAALDTNAANDSAIVATSIGAAPLPDAGTVDTGAELDAGAEDSAAITDSGAVADTGGAIDSGVALDSGAIADSGVMPAADVGTIDLGVSLGDSDTDEDSGCGCSASRRSRRSGFELGALAVLGLWARGRRRRSL